MKNRERALTWLWRVSAGDKVKILLMTLVEALLSGAAVASAWLLRGIIDCAVAKDPGGFWRFAALFIGLTAGQLALRAIYRHAAESCRSSLENRFKERLFGVLLDADYGSVTGIHSGEWMNRLTSDTTVVAEGMANILPEVCGMAVRLLGALAMLIALLPELSFVILPGGAVLVLLTWLFRKRMKRMHKDVQEADGTLRSYLMERLGAMLVLRAFGRQNATREEGREKMAAHRAARMKRNRFSNLCNIGFGIAIQGAYVLGAVFCGYGILTGTMSYGTFTAVLQLISQVQGPFANLSGVVPKFFGMLASAERLMEAETLSLDCPDGCLTEDQAQKLYEEMEALEFCNVSFTYPGDALPALENRSLCIGKGSYVAFTGQSGCGKSTALKLLLALYPIRSGELRLRLEKENRMLTSWHRALFAYVPQGNILMSGTVRQAVTFGKAAAEDKIWQALKIACAEVFVRQLEHGLDTQLGECGAGLSEGQTQRLAIARAVLAERPILLLDEATSALDEATEAAVLQNLREMTNKTVVIVTHRPAALEICDQEVTFG